MSSARPSPRLPRNYQLVHDVVRDQRPGMHATSGEIFAEARRRQPRIGYSTVYRALNRLRDLGLILEVRVPGAPSALYEPVSPGHAHFLCGRCGRVDDIDCTLAPSVLEEVTRSQSVEVTGVTLTLHGVCAACRRAGRGADASP